jgi:hypothetical protein
MLTILTVPDWLPLLGIGIVALAILAAISASFARKRAQAMSAAAIAIGFNFEGNDKTKAPNLTTTLFTKGSGKTFRNIMTGTSGGAAVTLFDYSYVTSDGRNAQTHAQTVACFSKSELRMPAFEMQPKGIMGKIVDALSHKNMNFDSYPDFSRRYQVRSPEQERARELFTPAVLSFLESMDAKTNWSMEGSGDTVIVFRANRRVKPEELRTFVEEASALVESFFRLSAARERVS